MHSFVRLRIGAVLRLVLFVHHRRFRTATTAYLDGTPVPWTRSYGVRTHNPDLPFLLIDPHILPSSKCLALYCGMLCLSTRIVRPHRHHHLVLPRLRRAKRCSSSKRNGRWNLRRASKDGSVFQSRSVHSLDVRKGTQNWDMTTDILPQSPISCMLFVGKTF